MTGALSVGDSISNPTNGIIPDKVWNEIMYASQTFDAMKGLDTHIVNNLDDWKTVLDSRAPHEEVLPGDWQNVVPFVRMVILKMLRLDKV